MTTARMIVTETARLPHPDDDWTAIVKVYLNGDAVEYWHVEAYLLHCRGGMLRRFVPACLETRIPAMAARLHEQVAEWLNANGSLVGREEAEQDRTAQCLGRSAGRR